jgi:protein gp37
MGDLWHPEVPDAFIDEVFATMAQAERHKFLVLTKRAERMYSYLSSQTRRVDVALTIQIRARTGENSLVPWPLPNVWLGVTAENQRMADERIPLLLKTPAAHHWVSLEPMLGPVDLAHIPLSGETGLDTLRGLGYHHEPGVGTNRWPHLDWVVVGGESGPGHRPMDLQWAADIYAQCRAANVPCYFKQRAASRPGQPSGVAALDTAKELPWTR